MRHIDVILRRVLHQPDPCILLQLQATRTQHPIWSNAAKKLLTATAIRVKSEEMGGEATSIYSTRTGIGGSLFISCQKSHGHQNMGRAMASFGA